MFNYQSKQLETSWRCILQVVDDDSRYIFADRRRDGCVVSIISDALL